MAKVKKKALKATEKKKWVQIVAPKIFNSQLIGETYVYDAREALGKTLTVNLMTLTRNPKDQGVNITFAINGQHEDKLTSEFNAIQMMPSVVRRMARRGKEKVEDSFVCTTIDSKKVRIKPILVTRAIAKGAVLAALRKGLRRHLLETVAKTSFEALSADVVDKKVQRGIHDALSKIFPLSSCNIRWLFLIKKEQVQAKKKKEAPRPQEAEKVVGEAA